jgi:peroxiredoxin
LRSFQQRLPDFDARGIRIVGISNDAPEVNRPHRAKHGYTFPLLSDPDAQVIRAYDLLHAGEGENGADISRPGEFLVDSQGIVRWVNLTDSYTARARPDQVLEAFDKLPK